MARQTLVTQLKQLLKDLTIRKGPFAVAMLLRAPGGSGRYWTFLCSAPWLDEVGLPGPAILTMIKEFERGLSPENAAQINRVNVLSPNHWFIQRLLEETAVPVRLGEVVEHYHWELDGTESPKVIFFVAQSLDEDVQTSHTSETQTVSAKRQRLVTQVKQLVGDLTIRKGPFAVAMLLRPSEDTGKHWRFLCSAPWLDKVGLPGPAIGAMLEELERGLSPENFARINCIHVLSPNDRFIQRLLEETYVPLGKVVEHYHWELDGTESPKVIFFVAQPIDEEGHEFNPYTSAT
jgi:hypothetical protein